MLQEIPAIPHTLAEILRLLLATFIAGAGGWFARRKKESAEARKLHAEARSIETATDLSLVNAAAEALTKANRVIDQCSHWERKAATLERRVVDAEADAAAAQLFIDQLTIAAKLSICEHFPEGVRLRHYSPRQLNPPEQK